MRIKKHRIGGNMQRDMHIPVNTTTLPCRWFSKAGGSKRDMIAFPNQAGTTATNDSVINDDKDSRLLRKQLWYTSRKERAPLPSTFLKSTTGNTQRPHIVSSPHSSWKGSDVRESGNGPHQIATSPPSIFSEILNTLCNASL